MLALLVGVGAFLYWRWRQPAEPTCADVAHEDNAARAIPICQSEYERTRDPATGARLANVYRWSSNAPAAAALANELLVTEARADALYILGKIAVSQNRSGDAAAAFEEARRLHNSRGQRRAVAKDALALAEIQSQRDQYGEALRTLDECITAAKDAVDLQTEGYCHLAAMRVLSYVGYFEEALREIEGAKKPLMVNVRDQASWFYERGNLHQLMARDDQHPRENQQAVATFRRALELATQARLSALVLTIHLNLTYSLAEAGEFEEAEQHLKEAGILDRSGRYESDRSELAARIAYRRGNLALASSVNERIYPSMEDDDDKMVVAVMQARIAIARNDLEEAARWARLGVESAEKLRRAQPTELRSWVLFSRREPFELLFQALAAAGRVEDAIGVFDQWQGRTLLDAMARPSSDPSQSLTATARKVSGLEQWLPAVSHAPFMEVNGRAVVETLRQIDLVAFAVADEYVWRLTASRGKLRLEGLGKLKDLRGDLDSFWGKPTSAELADQLGKRLLPEDVVRTTDEPLYVVLDASFEGMPFVALRRDGRPIIAARPVVRMPRFPTSRACTARPAISSAVVLADADGDLDGAKREASYVAALFRTKPLLGEAATSSALLSAKPDSLLHVAVHAGVGAGGGILKLRDGELSAAKIIADRLSPALVVLSGCETAIAKAPERTHSLATAFLAGGSGQVIATLHKADDEGASSFIRRFYDAGGAAEPARVLARVQAERAETSDLEWPYFAAFGSGACLP